MATPERPVGESALAVSQERRAGHATKMDQLIKDASEVIQGFFMGFFIDGWETGDVARATELLCGALLTQYQISLLGTQCVLLDDRLLPLKRDARLRARESVDMEADDEMLVDGRSCIERLMTQFNRAAGGLNHCRQLDADLRRLGRVLLPEENSSYEFPADIKLERAMVDGKPEVFARAMRCEQ